MYKLFEEKKNYLPMLTIRFWLTSKVQGNPAKKKDFDQRQKVEKTTLGQYVNDSYCMFLTLKNSLSSRNFKAMH